MLFPFQKLGAEFLASRQVALLADEMGLGKSAQAIHAADKVDAKRICVVCPAVARVNWAREFEKFSSQQRRFQIVRSQSEPLCSKSSHILSYDLLVSNIFGTDAQYDALILDEVHFLKSTQTKRSKAVWGRSGLVRRARRIWALSATPAPNDVSELWGLLYTFGATPLLLDGFVERYCEVVESPFGRKVVGNKSANLPELREILSSISIRRKKEEVLTELPPIFFNTVGVEAGEVDFTKHTSLAPFSLPPDRRDFLEAVKLQEECAQLAFAGTEDIEVLEGIAQSVSTLRRYNGLQKIKPTVDLVAAELEAGAYEKVVIFAIHVDVVKALLEGLKKFNPVAIYGGISPEARQENIDRFQDPNSGCRVFVGNIHAAGTAITLTAAHQVVFVEQDWVPGNNAQAAMRCHRIGQKSTVFVRFLSLREGIDSQIAAMCARKSKNLSQIGL